MTADEASIMSVSNMPTRIPRLGTFRGAKWAKRRSFAGCASRFRSPLNWFPLMELHDAEFVVAPQLEGPIERVDNGTGFGKGTYVSDEDAQKWLQSSKPISL